jgi:outer membrane receptor for ferrienterochelin and colicin
MSIQKQTKEIFQSAVLIFIISGSSVLMAQVSSQAALEESTVRYEADFFAEFSPVSVSDMIDRIPGINLAMRGGGNGGNGGNSNRRGLGSGAGEILINGQRVAGKSNEGRSQLSRISANQVDYIEIIRGTSDELDIRGGAQIVNVVLLEAASRSSISAEVNVTRHYDSTLDPGAKFSYTGQDGNFNYLFHVEADPLYQYRQRDETSHDLAGRLLETRNEVNIRNQTDLATGFNLGYQMQSTLLQFNGLYGQSAPPSAVERTINDYSGLALASRVEREKSENDRSNWEVSADLEHEFTNGNDFRFLYIANNREEDNSRERFQGEGEAAAKDLFLYNYGRDRERIVRTSYALALTETQAIEAGVERAQTIRDNNLRLGLAGSGVPDPDYGGLVPVSIINAQSSVEEMRYEDFLVHNWQLNTRMSLESSLIYETSTITQSGDIAKERDFAFLRPKIDYRFDITQTMQFRATVEKTVSQLSFADFSASVDQSDDDQNTQAGNPEIAQEQAWEYNLNIEYRLPNDLGVLSSGFYYRDLRDVIDLVDVSPSLQQPQSANGNIGDGTRWGANVEVSARLGFVGLANALLSVSYAAGDSKITDPFLGIERRVKNNNRGLGRVNFRHDVTKTNLSYGFNLTYPVNGGSGRQQIDIVDIEITRYQPFLNAFLEKRAFGGITFRFDMRNALDSRQCLKRIRYFGLTVDGIVEEVENSCSGNGITYGLSVRHTF